MGELLSPRLGELAISSAAVRCANQLDLRVRCDKQKVPAKKCTPHQLTWNLTFGTRSLQEKKQHMLQANPRRTRKGSMGGSGYSWPRSPESVFFCTGSPQRHALATRTFWPSRDFVVILVGLGFDRKPKGNPGHKLLGNKYNMGIRYVPNEGKDIRRNSYDRLVQGPA